MDGYYSIPTTNAFIHHKKRLFENMLISLQSSHLTRGMSFLSYLPETNLQSFEAKATRLLDWQQRRSAFKWACQFSSCRMLFVGSVVRWFSQSKVQGKLC